jgi:glycosyltransferase involved in cell wall biosynthesis
VKIAHLTTSGELGGAETSLLALLEGVREAEPGWELVVITPAEGRLVDRLRRAGIRARILAFPQALSAVGEPGASLTRAPWALGGMAWSTAAYARRLAGVLREEQPAIVHAHGFKMHVLAALVRSRRSALVWHVHGYLSGRPWTARALRALRSQVAAIIVNSRSVEGDIKQQLGRSATLHALYNAVDLDRFSPQGARLDLDALAGLSEAPPGTVRVGLVATYGRWKGHEVFFDAVTRVSTALPLRAYVIGAPIYATVGSQVSAGELRQALAARQLEARVGLTGFIEDMPSLMRTLDIVVHASTEPEPFGMVIAEAMACGRALVASRAGGATELFDEGIEALGHSPGSAGELADALATLVVDPSLRQRLGRAARARAEREFDPRRLAAALVPLYRRLAA